MHTSKNPIAADALDTSPQHHPDEDFDLDLDDPEHAEKHRILQRWLQRIFAATFLRQLTPKRWRSSGWIPGARMGYARLRRKRRKERQRRRWKIGGLTRIRIIWRRRFLIRSPWALLAGLRDAYVRLLLAVESRMATCAPHGSLAMGPFAAPSYAPYFPASIPKEYDPKILLQLYAASLEPPTRSLPPPPLAANGAPNN